MKAYSAVSSGLFVALLAASSQADIRDFIDENPKLAYSIKWEAERINYPGSYDQKESAKLSWPDWSEEMKQDLEDAFVEAQTWYSSPDPFNNLDETIEYPPTNLNPSVGSDTSSPWMNVSTDYAWDFYVRWVAHGLLVEYEGHFPWSVLDYDTEQLKILFDSTAMFARISSSEYSMSTGSPGHGNYNRRAGNMGQTLAAPPRYTYAFLNSAGLIGSDRLDTIERTLSWGSENLIHFYGAANFGNMEAHWQFRGPPPLSRIVEGTVRDGEATPRHWTAGCHGTTGFLRHALRAANIPVQVVMRCGHSVAHFITEGLYMDHGDDIYNSVFQSLGVSPLELLIDETKQQNYFGDNPHNNDDHCSSAEEAIGRRVYELSGDVEVCGDGLDNDADGLIDCDDSECPTREHRRAIKLTASDAVDEARLGVGMDASAGRIIVGAQGLSGTDEVHGAAYILSYESGAGWVEEAKLQPSNPAHDVFFGTSVSLDGDVALADSEISDGFAGNVYAFARQSDGTWTQEAVLQSSDNEAGDRFGISTALDGNVAIIGAYGDAAEQGAAYVFTRSGSGSWSEVQKLAASDGAAGDLFGYDVDIAGDLLVVGAYHTDQMGDRTGAAYVFRNSGGTWTQEAKLEADDAEAYAAFGWSVAIDGTRAIVGAFSQDDTVEISAGAAYVFDADAGWAQTAKLESPTPQYLGGFGYHVSLQGERAVVGAYGEDEATGAAYVFDFDGLGWELSETLKPEEGILGDRFGATVPMDGDSIYVGAYGDPSQGPLTGALYLYDRGTSPRGQCVNVDAAQTGDPDVTVTFTEVANGGTTTVVASTTGPALPVGFQLGDPATFYEISTTTDYVGRVEVCIDYSAVSYSDESTLRLLHYEDGAWVDLCDNPQGCDLDTANDVICAFADSLSPFVVAQKSMFPMVEIESGSNSADAIFLAQNFSSVGDELLLDVLVQNPQPNPWWLGQIQLTISMERENLYNQDLGTLQLTGLPLGEWTTVSFAVPSYIREVLLGSIATGRFTVHANTPGGAAPVTVNNLRFAGNLTERSESAPSRSSVPNVFSFEAAGDWSASGANLSLNDSDFTHGHASLQVERSQTYTPIQSAEFFTNELSSVGSELVVDVSVPSGVNWGDIQVLAACPNGQNLWIGNQQIWDQDPDTFYSLEFALPQNVIDTLSTPDQACSFSLVINAPTTSGDFLLDHLRLE